MYEANNKLLENYSFRRFESGGIRKTANFVPCVLATNLTVKMAKTLDISRVFLRLWGKNQKAVLWHKIQSQIPVGIILYEIKKGLNKRFFQKKHEKHLIFLSEYGIIRLYFIR